MSGPLRVTARLWGRLMLPHEGVLYLDALLMAARARLDCMPPITDESQIVEIPIPVAKSSCGRYYLASASIARVVERETRHVNKRFPTAEWQQLGGQKANRVQLSAGPSKHFRTPTEAHRLEADELVWYCVGDADQIRELLASITALGRLRGHGEGEVREWRVEPCETWHGFPVLAVDGAALRTLPLDTEGLRAHYRRQGNLLPPYWRRSTETEVAAPVPR